MDISFIAEAAALVGDPARANMLFALKEEGELSATDLASVAGVSASTASGHLAQMRIAGLIIVNQEGRSRRYRLADAEIAESLEAIEAMAARLTPRKSSALIRDPALRNARRCYDHLAGELGVRLADAFVKEKMLAGESDAFALRPKGERALNDLGIDVEALRASKRKLTKSCSDWSEGSYHLGGAVGAAVFHRFSELGWLRVAADGRTVKVTKVGAKSIPSLFANNPLVV